MKDEQTIQELDNDTFIGVARTACDLSIKNTAVGNYLSMALSRLRILNDAVERSGFDLSPCRLCGEVLICVPDGLPFCDRCAELEGNGQ